MRFLALIFLWCLWYDVGAQTTALPITYKSVKIYVMMTPSSGYDVVEVKAIENTTQLSLKQWLDRVITLPKEHPYNAIVVRSENSVRYVATPTENASDGVLSNLVPGGKDVYFFSIPTKEYVVVKEVETGTRLIGKGFYFLAKEYLNELSNQDMDGLIIDIHTVKSIRYIRE